MQDAPVIIARVIWIAVFAFSASVLIAAIGERSQPEARVGGPAAIQNGLRRPPVQDRVMGPSLSQASENVLRIGATTGEGRTRIESIQLEDYVARVIAGEGQPRAPDAAQEALAIAVRTFALANLHRHRREGFDLCDTTHCQVLGSATAAAARAAQATAGRVLVYHSQPAAIFYSARARCEWLD